MTIKFKIPSKPFGKQRPKFNGRTGVTYTPSETKEQEKLIKLAYTSVNSGKCFDSNQLLVLYIKAFYPIPANASKKKRVEMLSEKILPIIKPDYDNVEKTISDALNGIAYHDDKQIVKAVFMKYYSDFPRTEVRITDEINNL